MKIYWIIYSNFGWQQSKRQILICILFSLTNYLYSYGPAEEVKNKYNISQADYQKMSQYTANRISGILMLYLAKDYKRINDIANKYNFNNETINTIVPEIEGYISK